MSALSAALPPALRRRWRGAPRLALEDGPAAQLVDLLPLEPAERLLVAGRDSPLLASALADAAGLERPPLALVGRAAPLDPSAAADLGVDILRGRADRLPLPDDALTAIVLPHQLRRWNDARAARILEECWRVLDHNGVVALWDVAPSRSPSINRIWSLWLREGLRPPLLRRFADIGRLAYDAGFAWVQTLPIGPFLWPPGPRTAALLRKERYTPEVVERLHQPRG